jgi:hypothetical protein
MKSNYLIIDSQPGTEAREYTEFLFTYRLRGK